MTASAIGAELALVDELRGVLDAAGYDARRLPGTLGLSDDAHFGPEEALASTRRLGDGGRLPVLVRLLLAGLAAPRETAGAALAPLPLALLEEAGLLEPVPDGVRSRIRLTPHGGLLIASDHPREEPRLDMVPGPNAAGRTLWQLTVRAPVETALDLGAGCGMQALSLAGHAREVVATDINPRALGLLSLCARLNGIANVTCAEGSWFEPVAGRHFDLIACNPPFVISPDTGYLYRDSGMPADSVCRMFVEQAPEHLREGGVAQIMCNWVHEPGGDWSLPLRSWVEGTGCDALLLRYGSDDPVTYARRWNSALLRSQPEEFEPALDRWLAHFRDEGIRAIGVGVIVLRRRARGRPQVSAMSAVGPPRGVAGEHVARLLEAARHLARYEGDGLLGERLELVDGHRVEQRLSRRDGRYTRSPAVFRFDQGVGAEAQVASDALPVLFECDGSRTLGEIVHVTAQESGADENELAAVAIEAARSLLARGYLVRAESLPADLDRSGVSSVSTHSAPDRSEAASSRSTAT